LEQHFNTAWVQAAPSRWEEPFGNVATEAMMRGTAVVASAFGGLAEIVRNGETGFLVPPGEAAALAQALLRLVSDREAAERMGQAGRVVALTTFSQERVVERFVELYHRIYQVSCHRGYTTHV
jgi:glycosyltransferase involved in cell wall biosynthesis